MIKKAFCIRCAVLILLFLATIALFVNYFIYQYPGVMYVVLPELGITLIPIWLGLYLQFGKESQIVLTFNHVIHYYLIITIITYATYCIQFTPFHPIDAAIVGLESKVNISMDKIVIWTNNKPLLYSILDAAYFSIGYQLIFIPLMIIVARHDEYYKEFSFLVLITAIIGFSFYYFFPTTAPASMAESAGFLDAQKATGLKFNQIHRYIQPETAEGGMIALPSFHVIWVMLIQYMVRVWPVVFTLLLPLNILVTISCVLLGWHYPIDILGSFIVLAMGFAIYRWTCPALQPT